MLRRLFAPLLLLPVLAAAGEADVIDVQIKALGEQRYRVEATLRHADEGWSHYADAFEVLDESEQLLGTRVLYHPHVDEQPFTRSMTLTIPASVATLRVRAHDSVHAYGGRVIELAVPR